MAWALFLALTPKTTERSLTKSAQKRNEIKSDERSDAGEKTRRNNPGR